MLLIESLTLEQETQLSEFQQKWRQIARSTARINRQRAREAVSAAYAAMGKPEPTVLFLDGPQVAREVLAQQTAPQLAQQLGAPLLQLPLATQLWEQVRSQLAPPLLDRLISQMTVPPLAQMLAQLQTSVWNQLGELSEQQWEQMWLLPEQMWLQFWQQRQADLQQQLQNQPGGSWLLQLGNSLWEWGEPIGKHLDATFWESLKQQPLMQHWEQGFKTVMTMVGAVGIGFSALSRMMETRYPDLMDFCFSALHCSHHEAAWQALRSLFTECGSILPFEKTCLVFDRPTHLAFDAEDRLHAEAEASVRFADGYCLYHYQGVALPEKYGRLHPNQWQAEWLLEETNAEVRRVLIQGIGYAHLCQELQVSQLDTWREYTLLKIDQPVDVEPIYLLKMICPRTGSVHATRVPPDIQSAPEAIRWANWETDPVEFAVET